MLSLWNPFVLDTNSSKKFTNRTLLDTLFSDSLVNTHHWGIEYKKNEDGSLEVSVDVPGIVENDVVVEVTESNVLNIRGERKTKTSSYTVNKSFSVPEEYDTSAIKAELKNGVLTVTLPSLPVKTKESRKVPVTSVK